MFSQTHTDKKTKSSTQHADTMRTDNSTPLLISKFKTIASRRRGLIELRLSENRAPYEKETEDEIQKLNEEYQMLKASVVLKANAGNEDARRALAEDAGGKADIMDEMKLDANKYRAEEKKWGVMSSLYRNTISRNHTINSPVSTPNKTDSSPLIDKESLTGGATASTEINTSEDGCWKSRCVIL